MYFHHYTALESEEFNRDCLVKYKGENIQEKPSFSMFKEIDLANQIQLNLERLKFSKMTPIQRAVITYILQGFDVMGCAQTGSGKTIAFLLPIVNKMLSEGPPSTSSKYI
jgi:superfamily II DNA/RNA helicase